MEEDAPSYNPEEGSSIWYCTTPCYISIISISTSSPYIETCLLSLNSQTHRHASLPLTWAHFRYGRHNAHANRSWTIERTIGNCTPIVKFCRRHNHFSKAQQQSIVYTDHKPLKGFLESTFSRRYLHPIGLGTETVKSRHQVHRGTPAPF